MVKHKFCFIDWLDKSKKNKWLTFQELAHQQCILNTNPMLESYVVWAVALKFFLSNKGQGLES